MSEHAEGVGLSVRDLSKHYEGNAAVDGVNLTVRPGEFLTLLGPSGSGKTTTLNMIAGFVEPTAGDIVIDGRNVVGLAPHKRNIGVVFQHYALFPHMTVRENIAFPLKQRSTRKSEIARRVADALGLVHLEQLADRHPGQLSGGQQQRVALARAIVFEPTLLLMDEPLGALDKKLRGALQLEIRRLHRDLGKTVVYVTHDQEEALVLSDRIAIFNQGRIEQIGTPEELYDRPATIFAADFLGESTHFRGKLGESSGRRRVVVSEQVTLQAPADADGAAGDPVALIVRPERLFVSPPGAAIPPERNSVDGVVSEIIYVGGRRRVEARLADGLAVVAYEDPRGGDFIATVGALVTISWSPDDGALVRDLPESGVEVGPSLLPTGEPSRFAGPAPGAWV